ncbi:hypothetical protein M422DRAFT_268355 [Sphaerobolus stellatus SS14]|uniref:Uncharacterized protein n=1 Tax=Sphaerobolus stellatus (strain SS14) TaxID=990650 RepID=A0A0C9UMQ5_SPHS4|nr:hypothetical protein M422DRAFT_268355 [Sphaerobolus stellatus SS14]
MPPDRKHKLKSIFPVLALLATKQPELPPPSSVQEASFELLTGINISVPRPVSGVNGNYITERWLYTLNETECIWRFRLTAQQLVQVVNALELPDFIQTPNRYKFSKVEALGLVLARYRTAADQMELCIMYCHSQSAISELVTWMVMYLDVTSWYGIHLVVRMEVYRVPIRKRKDLYWRDSASTYVLRPAES